jgi:SAM-dependent methyltransferase
MRDDPIAREAFDRLADGYAARLATKAHNAFYDRPAVLALLPPVAGKRVLDAGRGPGAYAEWLVDHGAEVVGIDVSPRMLELTRGRLGAKALFLPADLSRPLDFPAAAFDLVLSALVLDYVADWAAVMREFFRVLRQPRHLVFQSPLFAQNRGPDDTLLHELVQPLRQMRGLWTAYPTRTRGYDNEEYFAILVQNTYGSEKGLTTLRRDHHGGTALKGPLATSEGFLRKGQRPLSLEQLENGLLVRKLVNECTELCKNIAGRVTAKFNPIGEYLRNPFLYPYDPTLTVALPT